METAPYTHFDTVPRRLKRVQPVQNCSKMCSETERGIIDGVISDYADWSMPELYQLCHKDGSPWSQCYTGEHGMEIPDSVIGAHYKSEIIRS